MPLKMSDLASVQEFRETDVETFTRIGKFNQREFESYILIASMPRGPFSIPNYGFKYAN